MNDLREGDRVPLRPSGWNYWRPFYMGHAWLAGCLPLPIVLLGAVLHSGELMAGGVVLSGLAQLLAIRSQRDAFFTPTRIHHRRGLLGLVSEDLPIRMVDQVLVDPVRWLPEMGHLTVQCGATYVQFECVPQAEARAQQILQFAQAARDRHAPRA
jgi:hypothetical protein